MSRMPTIYHSDAVFQAYIERTGSVEEAKQAIKDAAREQLEETES